MTPESGNNNSQSKLALAFLLGLGVAGVGAWVFTGGGSKVTAAKSEMPLAVAAQGGWHRGPGLA